jgi:hypothetical protein
VPVTCNVPSVLTAGVRQVSELRRYELIEARVRVYALRHDREEAPTPLGHTGDAGAPACLYFQVRKRCIR